MMRAGDFFAVQETILRRWSPQGRFATLVYGVSAGSAQPIWVGKKQPI